MTTFYEHRDQKLFIGEMTHYPFPNHVHELAELLIVTAGKARMMIDGMEYTLERGDAAAVFPMIPHSYEELEGDVHGLVAIFLTDIIPEYSATFRGLVPETPVLLQALNRPDTRRAVSRMTELDMEEDLPLCVAYLHVLLAGVLHSLSYRPVYDYMEMGPGERIMRFVAEHACEDITLESASHALGISVSNLSHFFAEKLHISFRGFVNANRISRARLLMRDPGLTMAMISDACGYASMRTFRRAFTREVGVLPSEFMLSMRRRVPVEPTA